MKAITYIRVGLPGSRQGTVILGVMVLAGFVRGDWIAAAIVLGIFGPYWLAARYQVGKARIENATRRLLGVDRRRTDRPRRPPPPPNPPPMRVMR